MMRMELLTADFIKCKEEGRLTFISWLTKYDGWCQLMTTVCEDKAELWLCYSRVSGGERLLADCDVVMLVVDVPGEAQD